MEVPPTVTLTPEAAQAVRALLLAEQATGWGLRLQIVGGGCEGFSYDLAFAPEPEPEDVALDAGGLRLFVDRRALPLIEGTTIGYRDGFTFANPRATRTCKCGASFR